MTAAISKALAPYRNVPAGFELVPVTPNVDMELMRQKLLEQGYVMIPIDPTPADIHAMAREMPQHGMQRIYVKQVYDALVRERSK